MTTGKFTSLTEQVQKVQWDYMAYVMDEPSPNLDRERFSPEICDFIEQCLQKEQRHRPSAYHLLQHAFITDTEATRLTVCSPSLLIAALAVLAAPWHQCSFRPVTWLSLCAWGWYRSSKTHGWAAMC